MTELKGIATKYRRELAKLLQDSDVNDPEMKNFPGGACDISNRLLAFI